MKSSGVPIIALIAAPAGIMGSSLHSFMRTIPQVKVAGQTVSPTETLTALPRLHPHLLVLDADLIGPALPLYLQNLRAKFPNLNIITLVNSPHQQELALTAGASHALLKGYLNDQLRRVILSAQNSAPVPPEQAANDLSFH
jgi:DNA-binding NarL/FixJ family response regulator